MSKKAIPCLEIAVCLPVKETYTYSVPESLTSRAEIGCRVMVPFRNQQVTGYILERKAMEPKGLFKDIKEVLDGEPLFPEVMVPFFQWMSEYYLYPIGRLIRSALPAGINRSPFKSGRITEQGIRAMAVLEPRSKEAELL
ncbi:MAG: primosomal protein N', partial [Deltaproteobacteria bacterium]|nr:primosomal protein N' [Deltaproteobacteria bacterium]